MLTIWGRDTSSNVQKVLWICEELNVEYKRIDAGGPFGGLTDEKFLKINPNSKIPVIKDGEFILYESHAIIKYLASKYNKRNFIPTDLEKIAKSNQWIDWVHTELGNAMIPILIGLIRTPEKNRDMKKINNSVEQSEKAWSILNKHLENNEWIGGKEFSLADIPAGVWVWRREELPIEKKPLININKWFKNLKQLESFQKIVMKPLS